MRLRSGSARIFSSLRRDFFLGNLLFYSTIKLIIDIITTVLSVAALPVFVLQLLAFSLSDLPFAETIRAGLAAVKIGYWKVLLIILASAAVGTYDENLNRIGD